MYWYYIIGKALQTKETKGNKREYGADGGTTLLWPVRIL
jgi:hypothetical protein